MVHAVGARCTQFSGPWRALHAVLQHGSRSWRTVHAVFGPLARAARSFATRFTQLAHGARSFFSAPREGSSHLPAGLTLHAVFGASETACTTPHLRVAWGKTACTVPQLREPCAGGLRQAPEANPPASLPLPPAAHAAATRQSNRFQGSSPPGGTRNVNRPEA